MLPRPLTGDPEGEEDQAEVEPGALAADVDEIVAELLPSRDVAIRVDLGHAREPRRDAVTGLVSGNVLDGNGLAGSIHFDLTGQQRPWPDEAHAAAEDAPQLR